jgi:hypothetical protein
LHSTTGDDHIEVSIAIEICAGGLVSLIEIRPINARTGKTAIRLAQEHAKSIVRTTRRCEDIDAAIVVDVPRCQTVTTRNIRK